MICSGTQTQSTPEHTPTLCSDLQRKKKGLRLIGIGIYHANVWVDQTDIPDAHRVKRMDFLWVCWFRKEPEYISGSHRAHLPKVGFVESTDEFAFSFIDPAIVIHGCHLIPAFYEGHTIDLLPVPQSISQCLNPSDDDNWVNFYVNM